MDKLPKVIAENEMTIAPDLTVRVMVLDNGQRIIPVEDMQRACEWLGVDLEGKNPDVFFQRSSQ